jgi:hypothetical protein
LSKGFDFTITGNIQQETLGQAWCLMPAIPAIQEAEISMITDEGQPGVKKQVRETLISTNNTGVVACTCDPGHAGGISRMVTDPSQLGQKIKTKPYLKIIMIIT